MLVRLTDNAGPSCASQLLPAGAGPARGHALIDQLGLLMARHHLMTMALRRASST